MRLNCRDRDCSDLNIMMDADAMFPKGFHPVSTAMDTSGSKLVHPKRRRDTTPAVRYYFIDFGVSMKFASMESRKRLNGGIGHDFEPPEFFEGPWDPFKVDMWRSGNIVLQFQKVSRSILF